MVEPAPRRPIANEAVLIANVGPVVASHEGTWNVELAATADALPRVALTVGSHGTSIVYAARRGGRVERVRRGVAGWWSPEQLIDGVSTRVSFDLQSDVGPTWELIGDDDAAVVAPLLAGGPASMWAQRLTPGSRPERVLVGSARAHAVTYAPGGAPHACMSTSKHPALSHATRGRQGWSTTVIGDESERCAIVVAADGTLVVVSADIARVDVVVRSSDQVWRRSSISTGLSFAAVDVATRANDTVIAFSDNRRITLARRQVDGTWTQTVLVPDAGGLVSVVSLALDTSGLARVAYAFAHDTGEPEIELALASELTSKPSTVIRQAKTRFESLSLVLDGQNLPHIAYAAGHGGVFHATLAR